MDSVVVIGLGHSGMSLAQAANHAGMKVCGSDVSESDVRGLTAKRSRIDDLINAAIAELIELGFCPTTDATVIASADVVVICVLTPLSADGGPDLTAVLTAAKTTVANSSPGTLIFLESTTYPGTTEEVVKPLLETSDMRAGADFHLSFSPERIDPDNRRFGIVNIV